MGELLRDIAGEGSNEYLRQQGRQTARRLLEAGLYGQLEYLQRTEVSKVADAKARYEAFGRDLRLLTSLSASILNFSRWTAEPDPERTRRYCIVVSDAVDFPEVLCWRSDGFVNEMATRHDDADLWGWDRPSRDRIVPPRSAEALLRAIPGAAELHAPFGHIGLMASAEAPMLAWRPIGQWLRANSA